MFNFIKSLFNHPQQPPVEVKASPFSSAELAALIISGSDSTAGVSVSPDNAMRVATVYACIRILADSIAQLPVKVYRKNPTGNKETLQGDPLTATLAHAPNSWMTSFEFRELMMTCLCLRGNFYAYINRNAKDDITELLPIMPGAVSLQRNGWKIVYDINLNDTIQRVGQDKIFHVRGLSLNGYEGISPISYQRNAIGLAMATENHGARTFKNGARPGGVLTHPGKLSEDALKNLRESWTATHGGENAGGTAIIEEGMTYANVAMTNEDAQYLDSRSFQRTEICSIFRVPPHMIGDLTKSSFSNITQQSLEFVKYTVLPWSRRIEAAISRDLLSDVQRKQGVYVELLVDGLERADIKTRYEAYKEGIINGWISPNEVRSLENMNPREGGDVYMMPLNMTDSSKKTEPKKEEPQQDIQADEADEGKSVSGDETMARMLMLSMLTKGDEKPVAEQQPQPIINITLPEIFVNNEQKAGEKRKQVHFTRDADGNMISAQVVEEEPK